MRYLITVVIAALSLNAFGQSGVCNYPISNVPTVVLLEENGVWLSATSSDPLIWDLAVVADSIFVTSCGVYQVQELVDFGDGWELPCAFISEIYVLNEDCTLTPDFCGEGTVWNAATSTCISANTADINNDGCVQLDDLLDLLISYGDCDAEESPWQCGDPLEYQGYEYETVQIGEQCWFAENLRAWNYTNGDTIEAQLSNSPWVLTTNGAIAVYGEHDDCSSSSPEIDPCDPEQAIDLYGCLYNGFTLFDDRGLCPVGWHVPSDVDWMTLEVFLGMSETEAALTNFRGTDQGIKLKSYFGWVSIGNGSNSSGFGGLPGGMRSGWPVGPEDQGDFRHAGDGAYYWTSSVAPSPGAFWGRELNHDSDNVGRNTWSPSFGFSVRCIKD